MKRKMKKVFGFILISFLFCFAQIYAQVSFDPNENFYKDAKNWETKGIISWLPQIRPYSVNTIKKILEDVKENGSEEDILLAEYYESKFFTKFWNVGITLSDDLKLSDTNNGVTNFFTVEPEVFGDASIHNLVGLGYKLGVLSQDSRVSEKSILPLFYTSNNNTYNDPFTVGSVISNIDMGANLTVGNDNVYGMLGINRLAFGPFLNDSVLLNGGQFHSGNLSFIYEGEKFGYSQIFSTISRATNNAESNSFFPEKYFAFHSFRFTPIKQFAVTYFETTVYTDRFDPSYFLPVPYMVIQGMYGASDNTMSGLVFDVRPIDRLGISLSTIIDDIDLNGFAIGEFDTKLKMALQGGINYVPEVSFVENLSLDYTLVTPYTYTHCRPGKKYDLKDIPSIKDNYNKDNFTNRLTSLGTKIPPNSDRIHFSGTFKPIDKLRLDFSTTFVRHANIAESLTDEEAKYFLDANNAVKDSGHYFATDGSIWASSITWGDTAWKNRFMQQEHKMYVLQVALNAEYELPRMKAGSLLFNFGYMFEYIYNKGVDEDIYRTGIDVAEAKKIWVANLRNVFNNYMSFSVKYYY